MKAIVCDKCQKVFDEQVFMGVHVGFSAIAYGQPERHDICSPCWQEMNR